MHKHKHGKFVDLVDHQEGFSWKLRCMSVIIMLEVAIRRWVNCDHEGMHTVSNNTQIGFIWFIGQQWFSGDQKLCQENIYYTITSL